MKRIPPALFYILSWTWGLPLSLCGAVILGILRLRGVPIRRFGLCRYAEIGHFWGGLELGMFFLKDTSSGVHVCLHESGHAIQNILLGPFMPLIVSIPSAIRYWYREIRRRRGKPLRGRYEDIWFEAHATALGYRFFQPELPEPICTLSKK